MAGKVVVNFGTAVHSLGMLPTQARELAASLVESADLIEKEPSCSTTGTKSYDGKYKRGKLDIR